MKLFILTSMKLKLLTVIWPSLFISKGLSAKAEGIHLPIHRRDGRFSNHAPANFPELSNAIAKPEARYVSSYQDVALNGLVRRWHQDDSLLDDVDILRSADSPWYTSITVGDPQQILDFELDMLRPDFLAVQTSSGLGQRYNTTSSRTHGKHLQERRTITD
jgi:hypothetical protein